MIGFEPCSDEQARALINLEQCYQVWMKASRDLAALPYDLRKKTVGKYSYLYEIADRGGNGHSLGPLSPELEARFEDYRRQKAALKDRIAASKAMLDESGQLCRALRVPFAASRAADLLLEADRRGMLDGQVMVVGTNAMPVYAAEAGGFLRDAPDETEDFDVAWVAEDAGDTPQTLWSWLKAVDPTFTINSEREFQARNRDAYEVEILVAPSRAQTIGRRDRPKPVPLPEQEWLLNGLPVDRVVATRTGGFARIVAPDPHWFALHKLWMADQDKRDRRKSDKDGRALIEAIATRMPHYPMDEVFRRSLPEELVSYCAAQGKA